MNPNANQLKTDYVVISGGSLGRHHVGSKIKALVEIVSDISGEISVYLRRVSHSDVATIITVSATPDGNKTADFALMPSTSVMIFDEEEL